MRSSFYNNLKFHEYITAMIENIPHKILVVEDDEIDAMAIERTFKRNYPQTHLIRVENGQDALDFLKANPYPDLILMDIRMPLLDGRETLHIIKQDERLKLIPVIMTSTSDNEDDIKFCYANHASGYIIKPNGLKSFDDMVKSIVGYWFQNCLMAHTQART